MLTPDLQRYAEQVALGVVPSVEDRVLIASLYQLAHASLHARPYAQLSLLEALQSMTAPRPVLVERLRG